MATAFRPMPQNLADGHRTCATTNIRKRNKKKHITYVYRNGVKVESRSDIEDLGKMPMVVFIRVSVHLSFLSVFLFFDA